MRIGSAGIGLALLLAACAGAGEAQDGPRVVATTTILGDLVENVTGEEASLEVLIPIGVDPHEFGPSSRQVALLEEADLVVANGLGLEEALDDVLDSVAAGGVRVLRIGPLLEPDWLGDSVKLDPHIWMDPLRMALAADLIATELEVIEPTGAWRANATGYRNRLDALDAEIVSLLGGVPEAQRLLVTNHDSLRYFADRYGFEVIGVVVPGGSTMAQPSSAALSELIDQIEALGVPAIFGETTEASALLDAIAAEPGLDVVVVDLFIGSLGEPGSGAATYIDMMRLDAQLIAEALG